jgi:hypothetical protein
MPSNGTAAQTAIEKDLYHIGDVSRLADLKPFVLRYWETELSVCSTTKDSRSPAPAATFASTAAQEKMTKSQFAEAKEQRSS